MALIKCVECGNEISDKAKACPKCACPVKEHKKCKECGNKLEPNDKECSVCGCPVKNTFRFNNKKLIFMIGAVVVIIGLTVFALIYFNKENTMTCVFSTSNNVGVMDYEIVYTFDKDGNIKLLTGLQYTKPTDSEIAEYLWNVSNKQQDQYNYYEGLSYKATYSEDKEITLNYSIDAKKAPSMFNAITSLSGVEGVTASSTKDEVRQIYEDNDYFCD